MSVTISTIVERWPVLYHMAAKGSWPSIRRHGLLSTRALLDLFEIRESRRTRILAAHRPDSVPISHPKHGDALVRDQKPMDDKGLTRCLEDGLAPRDWYRILNDKVFFWLTENRLNTMLGAKAYRNLPHTVLEVETRSLLSVHAHCILLSPMNSGCTKPFPFPRGRRTFAPLASYPYEERQKKNRKEPIVELAVSHGIPDLRDHVVRVLAVSREDEARQRLWTVVWEARGKTT